MELVEAHLGVAQVVAGEVLGKFNNSFFYSNRIKNRINILQEITELDIDKIQQDESLLIIILCGSLIERLVLSK